MAASMANAHAIVASWIAYSLRPAPGTSQPTAPGWHRKPTPRVPDHEELVQRRRASATRSFSCVTRKISYPCRFPADGAAFAAASTCATFSASTASGANARTDRRLLITSNRSTTRIIPLGGPQLATNDARSAKHARARAKRAYPSRSEISRADLPEYQDLDVDRCRFKIANRGESGRAGRSPSGNACGGR